MKHKHLSFQERYYIEIALKKGDSQNMIAKALNRSQGTISKEISRNCGERGYRYKRNFSLFTKNLNFTII